MPERINATEITGRTVGRLLHLRGNERAQLAPQRAQQGIIEVLEPAHWRGVGAPFRQLLIGWRRDRLPVRKTGFSQLTNRLKESPRKVPPIHQGRRQFLAEFLRRQQQQAVGARLRKGTFQRLRCGSRDKRQKIGSQLQAQPASRLDNHA
jgi:hypothetical protein